LGEGRQQLTAPFAELANLLVELFGGLNDLLSDIRLTREAQVIFIPTLDHQCWNDGKK